MKRKSMQGHVAINHFAMPRTSPSVKLAQLRPKPENAIIEVVLLPFLVPLIAWLMGRQDLFFLNTAFPWMLLIPTLTTSRYGTRYGLLSLLVMSSLSLLYVLIAQPAMLTTVTQVLVGSLLVVLVVGEMIQYWGKRTQQQAEALEGYRKSAQQSEQALQLLHISYSQLEEDLVAENQSLASSLRLLDTSIHQASLDSPAQAVKVAMQKMQEILQHYPWLEVAAFYRIDDKQRPYTKSLSSIGNVPVDIHQDPLMLEALRCKQAVSIQHTQLTEQRQLNTRLQAAIPLLDCHGKLWGVLAVVRMANSALTQQNLNLLALLCNYVSNLLDNSQRPMNTAKRLLQEMYSAMNVVLNTVRTATLLTIRLQETDDSAEYKDYFIAKVRGANRIWCLQHPSTTTLVILMPLFHAQDFQPFQKNLRDRFLKRFGKDFSSAGISLKVTPIRQKVSHDALQKYLINLGKFDDARLIR